MMSRLTLILGTEVEASKGDSMKKKAYVLVFDGFADWEGAHALCGIAMSGKLEIVTVGLSPEPVISMGGLKVIPDITVDTVIPSHSAIFILPGGTMWEESPSPTIDKFLRNLAAKNVLIAAICGATLAVARADLTQGVRHTSNALEYLKAHSPDYQNEATYVDAPAVSDGQLITAGGVYSLEFAREIFRKLGSFSETQIEHWFNLYKHGIWSEELVQVA
jgi:putative intracellular protease/amidase